MLCQKCVEINKKKLGVLSKSKAVSTNIGLKDDDTNGIVFDNGLLNLTNSYVTVQPDW